MIQITNVETGIQWNNSSFEVSQCWNVIHVDNDLFTCYHGSVSKNMVHISSFFIGEFISCIPTQIFISSANVKTKDQCWNRDCLPSNSFHFSNDGRKNNFALTYQILYLASWWSFVYKSNFQIKASRLLSTFFTNNLLASRSKMAAIRWWSLKRFGLYLNHINSSWQRQLSTITFIMGKLLPGNPWNRNLWSDIVAYYHALCGHFGFNDACVTKWLVLLW